ncbi:hydrogenase maturation protease [Streptomyces lydicus]|uniref:hydrogenase maturation protease n=1 Tax=Streptomyces lydicus TaxID=47763 RepID=UPI0009A070A8|nr:hydrogenase maturation protease [Streptomyces lydicus]
MNAAAPFAPPPGRTLIAGVGNIFLGDDGFGVEAVRRLGEHPLPEGVEVIDAGVRGIHLAYQMLDGYHTVLLVDATARGTEPGTLHLLDATDPAATRTRDTALDGHHMTPDAVLALLDTLSAGTGGRRPRRVMVLGCEPADLAEGIGLSQPVDAAVDEAVRMIRRLVGADPEPPAGAADTGPAGTEEPTEEPTEAPAGEPAAETADEPAPAVAGSHPTERNTTPC